MYSPWPHLTRILTLSLSTLWLLPSTFASSINFEWHDIYENKEFSIEAGFTTLFNGTLAGQDLIVEMDPFLAGDEIQKAATITVHDHEEMSIQVNVFRCGTSCKWQVNFTHLETPTSNLVQNVCQTIPRTIESHFNKYFFCRNAYQKYLAGDGVCWPESMAALTGWFEAAYNLHTQTNKNGLSFISRDMEAEAYIKDAMLACEDFEIDTRRNRGYFRGMMRNLDAAVLQQARRVEQLTEEQKKAEARAAAELLVKRLQAMEPIRNAVPPKDAAYVETIINRALRPTTEFILQ